MCQSTLWHVLHEYLLAYDSFSLWVVVYYAHVLFYVLQNCFIINVLSIEMCDDNIFIHDNI